ncbi:MAG: zinc-ribbon domain-containing protein [Alphaproteobacteria bacterium]|nr:zinc-ribbon domain-containing protein [Alphaproteobacteria bacterium]
MLIICPKCFAKYEVDVSQFKEETHIFQCSSCGKRFEESVYFGDEKNEKQSTVPPAFITEQPIVAPLSENDYIASNRVTMDFSPQSSVVLPEEFTPVNDMSTSWKRKIIFFILLFIVLGVVGGSAYIWLNRAIVLKKFPEVQKALNLITAPVESINKDSIPEKSISEDVLKTQEVILTPVENIASVQDDKLKDRILPVEMQDVKTDVLVGEVPFQSDNLLSEDIKPEQEQQVIQSEDFTEMEAVVQEVPVINEEVVPSAELLKVSGNADTEELSEEIILEEIPIPDETLALVELPQVAENGPVSEVEIRDISFKYDQSDVGVRLFVQGVLSNTLDRVIKMPPLQVQLFDANGTLLGVKDLPYGEAEMPSKSDEFFFYELSDIPAGTVTKVEVIVKR